MKELRPGALIGIPCTVTEGAFDNERLVDFDTMDGKVSGFTSPENVKEIDGHMYIRAEVQSVERDCLLVRVEGSFFSTNGLAHVSSHNALQMAA